MVSDEEFSALMARVRGGETDAAAELVRMYEPEIRRAARLKLHDPEMRRIVDSIDISQSVFGKFFSNLGEADFDLQKSVQLLALLTKMTSNRIIDEHRKLTAAKSGGDGMTVGIDPEQFSTPAPGPRTDLISKEEISAARSLLAADELMLLDRRQAGDSWDDIAQDVGHSAEALRKKLDRALKQVRENLSEDDGNLS